MISDRRPPVWRGPRPFGQTVAAYTYLIAWSLRYFGSVRVMCDTVHCSPGGARSRISNAAYRLGVKVSTRQEFDRSSRSYSIVGTLKTS